MENKESYSQFTFVLENPKGSYKSFEIEGDPVWEKYPLKGVTYPVDYGYVKGYLGEDGAELDMFVGSGTLNGCLKVSRLDVREETKFFTSLTQKELDEVLEAFKPVLMGHKVFENDKMFEEEIKKFKMK